MSQSNQPIPIIDELLSRFPYQFQQWPAIRRAAELELEPGWRPLFAQLCRDVDQVLSPEQRREFSWIAVRERFGAMRAYFAGALNPEVSQLIAQAEQASTRICRLCGNPGVLRRYDGYWATRCSYHGVEQAARALLMREHRLSWAHEADLNRRLRQWMDTPDPRWTGLAPRLLCATHAGTAILLELLMLQLEPPAQLH